jgi:molybdopterin-guanine dinucleotide biosynthesis protein A
VTLPVDVPGPPADLVARLTQAEASRVAVAEADGRRQWAVACWPMASALALAEAVAGGARRIEDAVLAVGWQAVPFADAAAFRNINTPADLAEFARALTRP